ncbi:hypothetical protein [Kroppenstedtia sanguinis]|uniref:Uncharacterized protein n=1 Tax=Kroppenstedtia sanguinis TaxID=1380684 RepID=A0ABW4CEL9_9BACL
MTKVKITPDGAVKRINRYLKKQGLDQEVAIDTVINAKLAAIGYHISISYVSKLAKRSVESGNPFPRKENMDFRVGRTIWQATVKEWYEVVYPPGVHIRPTGRKGLK